MIARIVIDIHPLLDMSEGQIEKVREEVRDYLTAVVLPDQEIALNPEITFGDGVPRWSHIHDATASRCDDCNDHARDGMG